MTAPGDLTLYTRAGEVVVVLHDEVSWQLMENNDRAPQVLVWGERLFVRGPLGYREADGVLAVGLSA